MAKPRIRNWMRRAFIAKDPELKNLISKSLYEEVEADCKQRAEKKKPKKDVDNKPS